MDTTTKAALKTTLYRWECSEHRQHGRWLANGNTSKALAFNHYDRRGGVCRPRIVDNQGRDQGPAI